MENENIVNQSTVTPSNLSHKRNTFLVIFICVLIIILAVVSFYLYKKLYVGQIKTKTIPISNTSDNTLPTPEPHGPFKYSSGVKPPELYKGALVLTISDKGFSDRVKVAQKGSSVIIFNFTSKDVKITITDAQDKTIDSIQIPVQKGSLPIIYDKAGTYKFKDNKGNIAVVTILP